MPFEVHPHETEGWEGGPTGGYAWRFRTDEGEISAECSRPFDSRDEAHRAAQDFAQAVLSGFGAARSDVPWSGPAVVDVER